MKVAATRNQLRRQRRSLNPSEQVAASNQLCTLLINHCWFKHSNRIAFYTANDGEINPAFAMAIATAAGKDCFLPVLHPLGQNRLYFARQHADTPMQINRYGIKEPRLSSRAITPSWALNLILVPLVGFDRNGNRIGMGGGFYDHTFMFKKRHPNYGPKLIGLAHDFQELDNISRQPWDIPLDGIITNRDVIDC